MPKSSPRRLYLIPVLSKALDVLEIFEKENKPLSLEAVYQRTRISKTTVYRILKTLTHRGYLMQSQDGLYRVFSHPRKRVFGFAGLSAEMPFSEAVTSGLIAAAADAGVELMVLDNRYDPAVAVRNAEEFIRNRVDLVIEFQIDQQVAAIIGDKMANSGIPLIAVHIPHPHAVFFGVNDFRVGFEAGHLLAAHAEKAWAAKVNWILGLDLVEAGPLVQSRITGAFEGIRSRLPQIPIESFVRMDGRGLQKESHQLVLDFLGRHSRDRRILIAAANDTSALGAVQAVRELKRTQQIAIAGQGCIDEAVAEMAAANSPLIGTVSYDAHLYGTNLIRLGLAMLAGQSVAPFNYIEHRLIAASRNRSNR